MRYYILCSILCLSLNACKNSEPNNNTATEQTNDAEEFTPPAPGTVVASESMAVKDELNDFKFSVKVLTNEYTRKGTYTIKASYGPNEGESMFTMPKGGAHLKPSIKKGEGYSYIVGFTHAGGFHDYYEVKALDQGMVTKISIKNVKAYAFQ